MSPLTKEEFEEGTKRIRTLLEKRFGEVCRLIEEMVDEQREE